MIKSKVTIIIGCSSVGKDYILRKLISDYDFKPLVSHTTRPIRPNETNHVDYHFISEDEFLQMNKDDEFIEYRTYNTLVNNIPAIWYYGLSKQKLYDENYVVILDVQGAKNFIEYYGVNNCIVVHVKCDPNITRRRSIDRGGHDEVEFKRRLDDDLRVFSYSELEGLVDLTIDNDGRFTIEEICEFILDNINSSVL